MAGEVSMEQSQAEMAAAMLQMTRLQTAAAQVGMLASCALAMKTARDLGEMLVGDQRDVVRSIYTFAERKALEIIAASSATAVGSK